MEVAKTNTSFLALAAVGTWINSGLLIAIPACYLGWVLSIFFPEVATFGVFTIDPSGQGRIFLSPTISSIPLVVLFLLLPSVLGGLSAVGVLRSARFLFLELGLMTIRVLLLLCKLISLRKSVVTRTASIYFFYWGLRLTGCFSLHINSLIDGFLPGIQVLTLFVRLGPNRKF